MTDKIHTTQQIRNIVAVIALVVPLVLFLLSLLMNVPEGIFSLGLVIFIGASLLALVLQGVILEVERGNRQ